MITYPLNNVEYTAEDAELYCATRTSGVYSTNDFSIRISDDGTKAIVSPGLAWIRNAEFSGKVVAQKTTIEVPLSKPDPVLDQHDAVAIRFDANANKSEIVLKAGDPGGSLPSIERTAVVYELFLYEIYYKNGAASQAIDLRSDESYCGIMQDAVTTALGNVGYIQFKNSTTQEANQNADIQKIDGKVVFGTGRYSIPLGSILTVGGGDVAESAIIQGSLGISGNLTIGNGGGDYVSVLTKEDILDQSPGKSITVQQVMLPIANDSGGSWYGCIQLPFIAKNTRYTAEITSATQMNVGIVSPVVADRTATCVAFTISGQYSQYTACLNEISCKITFAR